MQITLKQIIKVIILNSIFQNILAQDLNKSVLLEENLIKQDERTSKESKELIDFYFKDKKLIDLVDMLTKKRKVNYVIPQNKAIQEKFKGITVSYQPIDSTQITLKKAWELVTLFLELSGYAWFEKEKDIYQIASADSAKDPKAGVSREPLPLYVNTKIEDLPQDESRIRYVYYLTNLVITDKPTDPLNQIFKEMSSEGASAPLILPKANGFILIDKANIIASIINLIRQLDISGFRETIQFVPIYNLPATTVAATFDLLKKAAGKEEISPFIRAESRASISFFAADTQIIADTRNNALILMGREAAVDRIKDFISNYIDTIGQTGKSVLHYYDLQYLDAKSFAGVLKQLIGSESTKTGQGKEANASSINKRFRGVAIEAEEVKSISIKDYPSDNETVRTPDGAKFDAKGLTGSILTGGNRLIIAAMQDDWAEIESIIKRLDQPRPQVILEVAVADISHSKDKIIAGDIRSRAMDELLNGFSFLSSNIGPVNSVLPSTTTQSSTANVIQTLAADLLGTPNASTVPGGTYLTQLVQPGSFLLSFTDPTTSAGGYSTNSTSTVGGAVWALISVLDRYLDLRIITHPFLVTFNNTKATIKQSIVKRQRGGADPTQSGVIAVNIDNIPASIQLQMIPRINSENRLSLQVAVDIADFLNEGNTTDTSLTRETRRVETFVNLNSGNVFVIGGLTKLTETDVLTQTPFFGQIPIIGRFFQGVSKRIVVSNVAIFISPTIVMPRFRSGLHLHTSDKIAEARAWTDDSVIYGDNRDPITYFFLSNKEANMNLVNDYLEQTTNESEYQKEATADLIKREEHREETEKIIANLKENSTVETQGPKKIESIEEEKSLTDVPA